MKRGWHCSTAGGPSILSHWLMRARCGVTILRFNSHATWEAVQSGPASAKRFKLCREGLTTPTTPETENHVMPDVLTFAVDRHVCHMFCDTSVLFVHFCTMFVMRTTSFPRQVHHFCARARQTNTSADQDREGKNEREREKESMDE